MAFPPLLDRRRGIGLAVVAGLTLAQGIAAGAAAFATRGLFEAMHQGNAPAWTGLAILAGAGAVIAASRIWARQVGERIGQDYARKIRAALFEHAALMPAAVVAARRPGYISLRFVGDMTAFRNWVSLGLPRLVAAALLVPLMLSVLWLLDPVFVLAVGPVVAVVVVLLTWGGQRLVPLQRRLRARRARIAAEMAERMPLAPFLDRLGRRGKELAALDRRTEAMIAAALHHRRSVETLKALPDVAAGLSAALILLLGYRAGLGTGDLAAALAALGLLLAPLRDLGGVWNHHAAHAVAVAKAKAACAPAGRTLYRAGKSLPKGPVDIVFQDVSLPSGQRLSARIEGGTVTDLPMDGIDAERLADFLLGLDAPKTGRILLAGIDLADLSRGTLRRNVLDLGPDPVILHGSLRRALLMGFDDRPDDTRLIRLVQDVGLAGAMARLGGLSGTVQEGGKNLTRNERLAVAMARVRLARPRLIIVSPDNRESRISDLGNRADATILRLHHKEDAACASS